MLYPRPTPAQAVEFYRLDNYYTHGKQENSRQEFGWPWRLIGRIAGKLDKGAEPTPAWWDQTIGTATLRILEVGAGRGAALAMLRGKHHEVTGIEPDPAARAAARHEFGLELLAGTAEDMPNTGGSIDVVLLSHVLEHCLDPVRALDSAFQRLRPGGILIVEVPNNEAAGLRIFARNWLWLDVPRHLNFFTMKSLRKIVENRGFTVSAEQYRGFWRQFAPEWIAQQNEAGRIFGETTETGILRGIELLVRSSMGGRKRKYDSIRIVAVKP